LNLLGARSASLPPFIVTSLCQLFARITKQEWTYTDSSDHHPFHAPVSDLIATIDLNGGNQSMLALQLLSTLLTDFNSQAGMESVNKHRKGIALFRDSHIFEIFETSVSLLDTISQKDISTLQILHIGVQLASVRRTLFNGSERQTYLEHVVAGVKKVIENPDKLTEQMMDLSANSTYFLLTFWQRMVTSVPYVRSSEDHLLNLYCPEIMTAFVESRLQNVERVVRDGHDDPLEDQGATLQIMEHLSIICRCEYEKTARLLANAFDENARIMEAGPESDVRVHIAEGRLVWLVTLIGTAVFGKTAVSNNEEHDKMDGDLVARCLKFMRVNDNRLIFPTNVNANPGKGNVRLEITKSSPVYDKLNSELGVSDETDMLSVIVQKILTNLKYWATNEQILELSLSLLKDLSLGYTAVRKLFRLQEVQLLLSNHTAEHFVFLGQSVPYSTMKHRTVFYEALTRLLTIDLNDDEQLFDQFMQPLAATKRELTAIMTTANYTGSVSQDELQVSRCIQYHVTCCGRVVFLPAGVFRLYGDPCLQDSLDMFVKLFMKIPEEDFHILTSMMTSLMFGEVKCQWSISRPLLGLILLQEEVFTNFKREMISQQPEDRHAAFDQAFVALMDGVELSLTVKNKDIFTQNLAKFRRDVVEAVKGKEVSPSASNNEMC
ncbi:hypothetical protein ANCDUO_00444, partial [Ancylostoma duodenale]